MEYFHQELFNKTPVNTRVTAFSTRDELGIAPVYFAIPITLAASCAFMLPMATPPNAIVFASNKIKVVEMVKAGVFLNILAIILILILVVPLVKILF